MSPSPNDMPKKRPGDEDEECVLEIAHHRDFHGTPTGDIKMRTTSRTGSMLILPYPVFADFIFDVKDGVYDEYLRSEIE